jgi:hypothetical protein
MKGKILDKIQENHSTCYLTKIVLSDFVQSLSDNYQDYEVQREIVNNTYLDNLVDTVLEQRHIPPIVLVVDDGNFTLNGDNIELKQFKILDGLQRTFRIKLIWETIQFFKEEVHLSDDILTMTRLSLSRRYSERLEEINSNSKILESIINFYNLNSSTEENIDHCFNNYQWFEIWSNLTPQEEVNKMLILNAGHKPVKTQHQLEILFLNLLPIFKKTDLGQFQLFRQKESNSTIFSKNRKKGQFHFSHLITAILSLNEGKPITANVNLVHKAQSTDFNIDEFSKFFNYEFLHKLIALLLKFDDALEQAYGEKGTKWLGREVSMVGIFAALGKYGINNFQSPTELLDKLEHDIINNPQSLDLENFERTRNSLDLSKINIGTVNKNAIYDGVFAIFNGQVESINWLNYFKGLTV